jgi:hypothetical protein
LRPSKPGPEPSTILVSLDCGADARFSKKVFIGKSWIDRDALTATSAHDPHYDVLSAAVSGTAATMLTLLAMLGASSAHTVFLRILFDSQLVVLELALIVGVTGIIRKPDSQKEKLSYFAAILLITGTVLVSLGAALPIN